MATWDGERLDVQGSLLGLASFQGGGRLDRQGADLAVDVHSDNLGTLARAFSPQPLPEFTGSLVGTVALGADFGAGTCQAAVRLSDLRLQYQGRTIANREPVVAEIDPGAGDHPLLLPGRARHRERAVRLAAPWASQRDVPLDLRFQSTLVGHLGGAVPPRHQDRRAPSTSSAPSAARPSDPLLNGEGEIRGGQLIVPACAQALENVNGFLSFNRDRIVARRAAAPAWAAAPSGPPARSTLPGAGPRAGLPAQRLGEGHLAALPGVPPQPRRRRARP